MFQDLPLKPVSEATDLFVAGVLGGDPVRLEAQVSSADGMPLLCAVEAVLGERLPRATAQELVWLNGARAAGHVLQLKAYGAGGVLLAAVRHEFG